jgi:dipeptidyl aminopeptidase/acylaminoacyl peptidase
MIKLRYLLPIAFILLTLAPSAHAVGINNLCPAAEITPRSPQYTATGIILTTFDRAALWVYDIDRDRRYPLPETYPCPSNCRLSPDGQWLLYFNDQTNAFNQMRVDGTQRTLVTEYAAQVEWWSADTWLVWTPGRNAFLLNRSDGSREALDVRGVLSVQPGGRWGLLVEAVVDHFQRSLVDLTERSRRVPMGVDHPYFDDAAWSPDGSQLAYVAPVFSEGIETPTSSELFTISPTNPLPRQLTGLTDEYGRARINGLAASSLSWSPDGRKLAFWVAPLRGLDPTTDAASASIHIYDFDSGQTTRFCRFETLAHTPNPPRLSWSPDSTHIAFGADVADDAKPYLLLALNTQTGIFTLLSEGIFPALGQPEVTAWGLPPQ